jgi:hypothetical protein
LRFRRAREYTYGIEADDALKLAYEQAVDERDRIRAARQHFARQLGPIPTFAGITVALAGALAKVENRGLLVAALILFAAMVLVSIAYSRMPSYRQLRTRRRPGHTSAASAAHWYRTELQLERDLYGTPRTRNRLLLPRRNLDADLQTQLDRERTGVFVTQVLFLLVIAALVLARLV